MQMLQPQPVSLVLHGHHLKSSHIADDRHTPREDEVLELRITGVYILTDQNYEACEFKLV
jgi:hypothetical protein